MSEEELIRYLAYTPITDIWRRKFLIRQYCYANNIDIGWVI